MPARTFTSASSEKITLSLGTLNFAYGPGSMAFIVRPGLAATQIFFSAGSSSTVGYRLQAGTNGLLNSVLNSTGSAMTTGAMSANNWYLIGHSKATGTVAPNMHVYDYAADTWTHQAGAANQANSTAPSTRAAFGSIQAVGNFYGGDIAMGGVWNVVLSQSQFEALAYDLRAWFVVTPRALWVLDQDSVSQNLRDQTGNGANQSAITGTTLATSSVPILGRGAEAIAA